MSEPLPFNLVQGLKKIFVFFVTSFTVFFLVLNVFSFFNFATRQVELLAETSVVVAATRPGPSPQASFPPTGSLLPTIELTPVVIPAERLSNNLSIAKINIEAPLVFGRSESPKELSRDLERGVVVYPGFSLPGTGGELVILGHSAPSWWPKIKYEWVFSKLNDLVAGDEILLNFEGRSYSYRVRRKLFLSKGENLDVESDQVSRQFLYLLTCWPPGRDYKRLAVEAEFGVDK